MNEIQIFQNAQFGQIRTAVTESGEPLFCLADLCAALSIANHRNVRSRLDDEDVRQMDTPTTSGMQSITFVTEPGLYTVILRSDSPKAKPMQRWVASDVIPTIRKYGGYLTPQKIEEVLSNPDTIISLATQVKEERAKRIAAETQNARLVEREIENAPKVLLADSFQVTETLILMRDLAKLLNQNGVNIGEIRLYDRMVENHYLIRKQRWSNSKQRYEHDYTPTQTAADLKLFTMVPYPVPVAPGEPPLMKYTVKVTGKGVAYFINKFLNKVA